ncbi:MAG: FliM/FliN family flagellar motor switch protein [Planctomycetes bacterium]|nr:FliM/FliN family flagellar motor switch protein [Planctomycetota bacterium]
MGQTVDINNILSIQMPLSVLLAEKKMSVQEILELAPGSVIQFAKNHEAPLHLMANRKIIGSGVAVKVNENFGLQIKDMGRHEDTINALGGF